MSRLVLAMRGAGAFSILWAVYFLVDPSGAMEGWLADPALINEASESAMRQVGFAFMCIGGIHILLTIWEADNLGKWAMASGSLWMIGGLLQINDVFVAEIAVQNGQTYFSLAMNYVIGGALVYLGMQENE